LAVKSRIKDSLLSQAIKQKLSLKHRVVDVRAVGMTTTSSTSAASASSAASGASTTDTHTANHSNADDEEKAKLLLGTRHIVPSSKILGRKK
jgi:hypothetical protein